MRTIKRNTRIIICPKCHGSAFVSERENFYETKSYPCDYCGGSRVVIEQEVITHERISED